MGCTYLVLPITEIDNIVYSECGLNGIYNKDVVVKNVAETEFIVKWCDAMPPSIYALDPVGDEDVKDVKTQEEILALLQTAEWSQQIEE